MYMEPPLIIYIYIRRAWIVFNVLQSIRSAVVKAIPTSLRFVDSSKARFKSTGHRARTLQRTPRRTAREPCREPAKNPMENTHITETMNGPSTSQNHHSCHTVPGSKKGLLSEAHNIYRCKPFLLCYVLSALSIFFITSITSHHHHHHWFNQYTDMQVYILTTYSYRQTSLY